MKKIFLFLFSLSLYLFSATLKDEINYGVYLYKSHKYEKALQVFDKLLIEHPHSKRIRLEYARVLFALKMYDESKEEFQKVLATNPPPIVKKNIKYFLRLIEKRQKTNFFHTSVSIGVTQDTNIENKSNNPVYAGFVDVNTKKRKDTYTTFELGINHIKKLKKSKLVNSLYFYDEYRHDKDLDKITFVSLSTNYYFPLLFGLHFSTPLSYNTTFIEQEGYQKSLRLTPMIERTTQNLSTVFNFILEKSKNYSDKEKNYFDFGIQARYFWLYKKLSNSMSFKMQKFKRENGNRLDIAKDRFAFGISTKYPLRETTLLMLFYNRTSDTYEESDPTIKDNRQDKTNNLSLSLQEILTRKQKIELSVSKVKNRSNLDFYSYDKSLFSIKYTHLF